MNIYFYAASVQQIISIQLASQNSAIPVRYKAAILIKAERNFKDAQSIPRYNSFVEFLLNSADQDPPPPTKKKPHCSTPV